MPEIVKILTDDHDTITHLLTEDEEYLSVEDLAAKLEAGEDYYVTFGGTDRYSITIVGEEHHLEPTVDDPSGQYSMRDLPKEEDPAEEEIERMYEERERMGEFDDSEDEEDDDELENYKG